MRKSFVISLLTVYFEVYGCQMNVNDTEVAWSILKDAGYIKTTDVKEVLDNISPLHDGTLSNTL